MNTCQVIQVIRTDLLRRGDGDKTPIRYITQYFSLEGELLCEHDPCANRFDGCGDRKIFLSTIRVDGALMQWSVDEATIPPELVEHAMKRAQPSISISLTPKGLTD